MRFVSLFAGIGGIDLGLERAGHTCVGQVEYAPYPQAILHKHWPHIHRIPDVHHYNGHEFGPFELLTGGYPCQPFSHAGNRKGANDDRHLWPEMDRIIRAIRPQYVLLENVTGHLSLGFDTVLGNLAASGYDAVWDCIPASAVGAPHRRDRLFILAKRRGINVTRDHEWDVCTCCGNAYCRRHHAHEHECDCIGIDTAHDLRYRLEVDATLGLLAYPSREQQPSLLDHRRTTRSRPPAPARIQNRVDTHRGLRTQSHDWSTEPRVDRVADGLPDHMDRIKALGNAVVPQVAEWIARTWLPET